MAKNSVRIRLKAYENRSLDAAAEKLLLDTALRRLSDLFRCLLNVRSLRSCVLFTSIRIPVSSLKSAHTRD